MAVSLDKKFDEKLATLEGISTPYWLRCQPPELEKASLFGSFSRYRLKPAFEGSSKGVHSSSTGRFTSTGQSTPRMRC